VAGCLDAALAKVPGYKDIIVVIIIIIGIIIIIIIIIAIIVGIIVIGSGGSVCSRMCGSRRGDP
jgi:hypothetical protein